MQRVPLSCTQFLTKDTKLDGTTGSPPLIFLVLWDFFSNFFVAKGSPLKFFDTLQQTEVSKSPKGLPFLLFRHYETFKILIFLFFEILPKIVSNFLMSPKGPPFNFLNILQKIGFSKSRKGPPFYNIQNFALFEP